MPNGNQVRIVCTPPDVSVWVAGPIPGDCNNPDCELEGSDFTPITTSNGVKSRDLENGSRYCVKYHHEGGQPGTFGSIELFCNGAAAPFITIPFGYTSAGIADGQRCFCVDC